MGDSAVLQPSLKQAWDSQPWFSHCPLLSMGGPNQAAHSSAALRARETISITGAGGGVVHRLIEMSTTEQHLLRGSCCSYTQIIKPTAQERAILGPQQEQNMYVHTQL